MTGKSAAEALLPEEIAAARKRVISDALDVNARLNLLPPGSLLAAVSAAPGTADKIALPRPLTPSQAVDQVVERARLAARGNIPEIELLLRPESLGALRIKVSTKNRQVSVRVMAENTSAADLMSAHLAQLESDLAAFGLEMTRFDVRVVQNVPDSAAGAENAVVAVRRKEAPAGGRETPATPAGAPVALRRGVDFFA
jgi:hypothetical protein